ncbi:hypothetical protein [Asticcacaulis sp. AC402]|uniref:hypothetical protein n=1 Tax=Asticcacaulis sp. AC402 TaxID=1282361 RepID=UPI0003C3F860|nr:hypothetical protein [Asticcacaulis sp. AC402]ESQ74682.1 hypothetical protein ABAC402_13065 [Asticcacaulis sp. AC402]
MAKGDLPLDNHAERIICIMDAIDHGLTAAETLEECPACAPGLTARESLRHDDMGWSMPTCLSEMP